MIRIEIKGVPELNAKLSRLPKALKEEIQQRASMRIVEELKRRAEYQYNILGYGMGYVSTGEGLKSMQVRQTENGAIFEILAPYMILLEEGVRDHWVSQEIIEYHLSNPGATVGMTAKDLGLAPPYNGPPVYWHWKGPFVAPAMGSIKGEISNIIRPYLDKAIQRSLK